MELSFRALHCGWDPGAAQFAAGIDRPIVKASFHSSKGPEAMICDIIVLSKRIVTIRRARKGRLCAEKTARLRLSEELRGMPLESG